MSQKPCYNMLAGMFISATLCFGLSSSLAHADDITIQDTSGFTRAASQVDGSSDVDFAVMGPSGAAADGAAVTLTNAATGEVLTATSVGGTATFQGVTPGVWTVATTAPGVTFTNVAIASAVAAGAGIGTAGVLVPALAVAGAGAGAAVTISDDSNDDDEISPSS